MDGFIVEVGDNDGLIVIDGLLDGDDGLQVPPNSCVVDDPKLESTLKKVLLHSSTIVPQ